MDGWERGRGHQMKRSEAALSPRPGSAKLGRTSGLMAIGAWAARVEIAKMIEAGVPAKEILSEIRKGEEGDFPLPPFEPTVTHSGSSTPGSSATPRPGRDTGVSSTTSRSEPPRGAPWEKPRHGSPVSVSPTSAAGGYSSGLPEWAKKGDGPRMTFRKQAVAPAEANLPDWAKPEVKEADRKSERAVESEFEYTPTEPMTELVESGIFKNFKKKAEPPEREWELVDQTRGYVPIKLPSRSNPLETEKLETFRSLSKALFEELVVLKIKMDLVETVVEGGELLEDRFHILTEPRSAGTGLRYARLLKRYVDAYQEHGDPEKAPQDLFSEGFMQKFILQLISDGSGFRTPQSLVYAIEHFGGVFGFETPGPRHARIRKMANDYSAKAPERNPAPLFEVGMLEYLEGVVLDSGRDLQTRVACGKLRVCIQASVRHSDLGGTSMSAVEWCRPVGRTEILGLRAKAAYTKSGPRPWAAAWVAVSASNDQWLFVWVDLLIKMHNLASGFQGDEGWKKHDFVGCASDGMGGFRTCPPLITEDTLVVKKCLMDDLERGRDVPLDEAAIRKLRWHSCKNTIPSYMVHFGITPRTVRYQGAWKKASQAMSDLYLRESQSIVLKAQWRVMDQIRRGAAVQSLTGVTLDHRPLKPDWGTVNEYLWSGKVPEFQGGEPFSPNSLLLGVLNALKNGRLGAGWSGRVPGRLVSHFLLFVSHFFSFVSQARCLWSGSRLACLPLPFICLPLLFICLPVLFICLPGWVLVVGFPAGLSPTSFHLGSHFLSFVSHFFSFVSHFFSFVSQFFSFVSQAGYHLCNGPNQQGKNAA